MNENEIERQLQQAPLAKPSTDLDRRMRILFDDAAFARPHPLRRPVPLWLMAVACVGCAAAGFAARSLFTARQQTSRVVYIVPGNEELMRLLTGHSSVGKNGLDLSHLKVRVITGPLQNPDAL